MPLAVYVLCRRDTPPAAQLLARRGVAGQLVTFSVRVLAPADVPEDVRRACPYEPRQALVFSGPEHDRERELVEDELAPSAADATGGIVVRDSGAVLYEAWDTELVRRALDEASRGSLHTLDRALAHLPHDVSRAPLLAVKLAQLAEKHPALWGRFARAAAHNRRACLDALDEANALDLVTETAQRLPEEKALGDVVRSFDELRCVDEAARITFPGKRGIGAWLARYLKGEKLAEAAIRHWAHSAGSRKVLAAALVEALVNGPRDQVPRVLEALRVLNVVEALKRLPADPPADVPARDYGSLVEHLTREQERLARRAADWPMD